MRILFLAHRTPYPPNKGEKIRAFHLLSHLAKSHEVTLLYWVDDPEDLNHTPFLRSLCRGRVIPIRLNRSLAMLRALLSWLTGRSLTEGFYGSKLFEKELNQVLTSQTFDAVFVFSSAVARYAKNLDCVTKIVDFVDVDSDKWGQLARVSSFPRSFLLRVEQRRLSKFEISISEWASVSLFVSMAEAELFKKIGGKGRIEFLSNGTDLEVRRLPLEHIPFHAGGANRVRRPNAPTVVFVGTMDYYPNIDAVRFFVDEIFPLVRQKFSRASFEIIGRRPSKSVQRLNKIDGVRVVGEVSDVRSRLVCADLSVAPMRIARGVQNKVLEAMAVGVPVVATPLAIEGIDVRDGEDVLVGSSREEFAAQVTRVLTDSELRRTLTKKAWNKMNQSYNWGSIGAKLEQLLFTAPSFKSIEPAKAEISVGQR
jgi:sugar transferase (PEP-CTERM/EpsH1 system associated)